MDLSLTLFSYSLESVDIAGDIAIIVAVKAYHGQTGGAHPSVTVGRAFRVQQSLIDCDSGHSKAESVLNAGKTQFPSCSAYIFNEDFRMKNQMKNRRKNRMKIRF